MEILLNLLWFALLAPAVWLWRRRQTPAQRPQAESTRFLLCLGCALFLLFPVISATDDLQAMRAEIEEPGPSKRAVKQAGEKAPLHSRLISSAAVLSESFRFVLGDLGEQSRVVASLALESVRLIIRCGRAPPSSFLS
jgi:hypothetical protein